MVMEDLFGKSNWVKWWRILTSLVGSAESNILLPFYLNPFSSLPL